MGKAKDSARVKLIIGFIFNNNGFLTSAKKILVRKFGKIDFQSRVIPFVHTDYYDKEFGGGLNRTFISFQRLIRPQALPGIKIFTNKIEQRLAAHNQRRINIDPGYIDLSKLILATTKDYNHRIYLDKGIFAEVTLFYKNKAFRWWDWTYPDYKTEDYIQIFNQIREIYAKQIAKA